ncbi:MAG: hypothetical protein ACPH5J_06535 [Candidatus Puniceispirillum sp.]
MPIICLFFGKCRHSAHRAAKLALIFFGYFLLFLNGLANITNASASAMCHASADIESPRSELLMRCDYPPTTIQFEDEHPHLDPAQFALEPIDITAPLPDKHELPPLQPDAHVLLLSALYEFGDVEQRSILTSFFNDEDDDIFAWIEEDLYVLEFFKEIYPVQLIDQKPDYAVTLAVDIQVACSCPGGIALEKWAGTGNLVLDFPVQKGALNSMSLTNSTGSRFDGVLDFTLSQTSDNLFTSDYARIQFQIDGGDRHSWNASIKGAINGSRATGTTGHFTASHFDLEAGLIGQFKSPDK